MVDDRRLILVVKIIPGNKIAGLPDFANTKLLLYFGRRQNKNKNI